MDYSRFRKRLARAKKLRLHRDYSSVEAAYTEYTSRSAPNLTEDLAAQLPLATKPARAPHSETPLLLSEPAPSAPEGELLLTNDTALFLRAPHAAPETEDEPPFDAPDVEDEIFGAPGAASDAEPEIDDAEAYAQGEYAQQAKGPSRRPAPAISVHIAWDRAETEAIIQACVDDPRLARAEISDEHGGIGAAIKRFSSEASPDLLILDTALGPDDMRAQLERLAGILNGPTKFLVIGAINDVKLLRDLDRLGVSNYLLTPVTPQDLAGAICALFADADKSRVIAVAGARGGVGASTVAFNLAWSIAERLDVATTLVDLDLAFGASGFGLGAKPANTLADALLGKAAIDEDLFARAATPRGARLNVLTAPASMLSTFDFDAYAVEEALAHVRRASAFVVLDLPHIWTPWVTRLLTNADETLIVAAPDLASLRNAKQMLEWLNARRPTGAEAALALSMREATSRHDISDKDFVHAVGAEPLADFVFDPALFGMAEMKAMALGEAAPRSKPALAFEALARALTGRERLVTSRKFRRRSLKDETNETLELTEVAPENESVAAPETNQTAPVDAAPAADSASAADLAIECADDTGALGEEQTLAQAAPEAASESDPAATHQPVERHGHAKRGVRKVAYQAGVHARRGRPGLVRTAVALISLTWLGTTTFGQNALAEFAPFAPAPVSFAPAPAAPPAIAPGESAAPEALPEPLAPNAY